MCRFKCCCMQNNNNTEALEKACQNVGTVAEYASMNDNSNWQNMNNMCECGFDEVTNLFPTNPMLAQSYVPIQYMDKTFTPCCGLKMGTIFPELVSPYEPCQSIEEINYLMARNSIGEGCNKC